MASARAALGRARRGMIKRKKTAGVVKGALGTAATVTAFGASQAKKADTAWDEYEAGYKEMGGDLAEIEKPGFFKRTVQQILPGGKTGLPEGEVRIGAKMYDRGQIQKAGVFLGSDAAAGLSQEQRQQYLERTVPGRAQTTKEISTTRESLRPKMPFTEGKYDVDAEFDYDAWTAETPVYQPGEEPGLATVGEDWGTPPGGSYERWEADQSALGTTVPMPEDMSGINKAIGGTMRYQDWQQRQQEGQKRFRETGTYSFAKGGDFITNGPQKIIVGDNPGGRERVIVEPLPPKEGKSDHDEAKYGRYGDDAMKVIDGELAHINSKLEKYMSPEDIKKLAMGGTINPITGKKEYFLGALATGLGIAGSLYGGFSAMGNKADVTAGRAAAGDIYQQQLGLLGDVRTQAVSGATQQAELGFDATQSQIAAGGRGATMGARTAMRGVQEAGTSAISQAGLATSGTIQQKSAIQAGDVSAKLKSDMTKLLETRQLAEKERDLSISTAKEKADLAYRSGQMSAEEAYESTLTGLESVPTTFMEGLFG